MLPSEPPRGPFRRLLQYFGLVAPPDDRFRTSSPAPPPPARVDDTERGAGSPSALERGSRTALAFFGLVENPYRSRYGAEVSRELDSDVDALRARVAELERRLAAFDERR